MNSFVELNVDNFNEVLAAEARPFLVVFAASWCAPCHAMEKEFGKLSCRLGNVCAMGHVDVGVSPTLAQRYVIRTVPAVGVFAQGRLLDVISGVLKADVMLGRVKSALGH